VIWSQNQNGGVGEVQQEENRGVAKKISVAASWIVVAMIIWIFLVYILAPCGNPLFGGIEVLLGSGRSINRPNKECICYWSPNDILLSSYVSGNLFLELNLS
jgi:hypothetical protein